MLSTLRHTHISTYFMGKRISTQGAVYILTFSPATEFRNNVLGRLYQINCLKIEWYVGGGGIEVNPPFSKQVSATTMDLETYVKP